jgi:carbonic anhydrase
LEFGSHGESLATRTALLNVQKTVDSIFKMSPLLRGMIQEQKFSIVGGIYGLHTGEVLFDQDQIFQKLLQKENSELVDSICSAG